MDAGYHILQEAVKANLLVPHWMHDLPKPNTPQAFPLSAPLPNIESIPSNPFFVTDGSWFPNSKCGGGIAIGNADTLDYRVHHSFAVEVYVA